MKTRILGTFFSFSFGLGWRKHLFGCNPQFGNRLGPFVLLVSREVHLSDEFIDLVHAIEKVAEMSRGVPNRQEPTPEGPGPSPILLAIPARTVRPLFRADRRAGFRAAPW